MYIFQRLICILRITFIAIILTSAWVVFSEDFIVLCYQVVYYECTHYRKSHTVR